MDQDPTYDRRESEALAVTLGTGDKTKLSKALYGPALWPVGRPRDERSKLLTGALLVIARDEVRGWAVEPWLRHHGIPVDQGLSVLAWLGHGERLGNCWVQNVVSQYNPDAWDMDKARGVYRHRFSNVIPLDPGLHGACDQIINAILEAQPGISESLSMYDTWKWAPAGVVECLEWWEDSSRYYGGRAPMARMAELPDDALRCICEQLVPPVLRSNEELIAEARVYCDEHTTWTALPTCHVDDLFGLTSECQDLESDVAERIGQWHRERGPVAVQLRLVSRDWCRALEKPTNILKAELARLKQHKDMLGSAKTRVFEEMWRREDDD